MSAIYDAFLPYRDNHGLNQIEKGVVSQNGALSTVEYLLCLHRNGGQTEEFWDEVRRIFAVFKKLEPKPGLSIRFPGSTERDSMDNNAALLVFSRLFGGKDFAYRMRERGLKVRASTFDTTYDAELHARCWPWVMLLYLGKPSQFWNNQRPDEFCFSGWFGRSPGFLGLIDLAYVEYTSIFRNLSLLVGQFLCLREPLDSTSDRKLSYVVWQMLITQGKTWRVAYWIWDKLLRRQYKNGMSDVYSIFYGSDHPIVKYSR